MEENIYTCEILNTINTNIYFGCSATGNIKMSKSLIKTVDGIGIWVRDDVTTYNWFSIREIVSYTISFIVAAIVDYIALKGYPAFSSLSDSVQIAFSLICIGYIVWFLCMLVFSWVLNYCWNDIPAYEVYPGSDINNSILIHKTTNEKADQIAICKAAKEIESRCHEIAKNRRELDRIAGNCK